jgi:ankyrin repeat protein
VKDPYFIDELDCNDAAPYRRRQAFMKAVDEGDILAVRSARAWFPQACEWTSDSGHTALQSAIYHGRQEIMEFLLEKGAAINRRGHHGTPLIYAVYSHDYAAARWLLSKGADASLTNPEGETALMWAVLNEMPGVMPDLVKACPEALNMPDNDGNTPFARAAEWGYAGIARLLIQHGACTDTRNKAGETPADVALRRGHRDIPGIIRDTVADIAQGLHAGLETPLTIHSKPLKLKKGISLS